MICVGLRTLRGWHGWRETRLLLPAKRGRGGAKKTKPRDIGRLAHHSMRKINSSTAVKTRSGNSQPLRRGALVYREDKVGVQRGQSWCTERTRNLEVMEAMGQHGRVIHRCIRLAETRSLARTDRQSDVMVKSYSLVYREDMIFALGALYASMS